MIIEVEDRFCKVANVFSKVLEKLERAAERGDAVHEVEETTWSGLIEMGREMIATYIQKQEEESPRPQARKRRGLWSKGASVPPRGRPHRPGSCPGNPAR